MAELIDKRLAQVLKPSGFYGLWLTACKTLDQAEAYEKIEGIHQRVDDKGARKYSDFGSFYRVVTRNRAKEKAPLV